MSLSNIIDAIHTEMDTLFSATKTVIPNPYSLSDNPVVYLKDGYCLQVNEEGTAIGGALKDDNAIRAFTFILTKEVFRLESNYEIMRSATKTILADQRSFKDRILDFDQLGIEEQINKIEFLTASGIEFIDADEYNFITCNLSFTVEYAIQI
jgi:hypothetical protein